MFPTMSSWEAVVEDRVAEPGAAVGEQGHERGPGGEHLVGGDGPQVLEQADSRAEPLPGRLPGGFGARRPRGGEGQQVDDDQRAGQGVLAVADVVFEVVAVLPEDVEGLVLDLPAGAGEFGDVVAVSRRGW